MTTGDTPQQSFADTPLANPETVEIALHELGESLAATLNALQVELGNYPNVLGAFIVDEFAVDIPLRLRVDKLGQPLAALVLDEAATSEITRLHLRLRPVLGASQPVSGITRQPLAVLRAFSDDAIERLATHRIFSVEDFHRVARNPAGHRALDALALDLNVDGVLDRIGVLALPIDSRVAESLLEIGVTSRAHFARANPEQLAEQLSERLQQRVSSDDIVAAQEGVRVADRLRFPSRGRGLGE